MKHAKLIITAMLLVLATPVLAAPPPGSSGNAELDAARKECAESAGKDSNGRPDRAAMDSCMLDKGFAKPEGRGPNRGGPQGASSGDAELDAARKECAENAGEDSNGRPDRAAMDSCMQAKGYAKPAGK